MPDIKQWKKICSMSSHNIQIAKYFNVCQETLYSFMDRERYKEEKDESFTSEYLASLKDERNRTREFIASKFLENIKKGDNSSVIFGMKVFNGSIEQKDADIIELKKQEVALKSKQFLTQLAEKFNLNPDQLQKFAEAYFKPVEMG